METIWSMVEQYRILLSEVVVDVRIFLFFTTIIITLYIARAIMLINIEKQKILKEKRKIKDQLNDVILYIWGHILIELLFGFLVGYLIIKLTLARWDSPIINFIVAPASGFISSIWFDNVFIYKLENNTYLGTLLTKKSKKSSDNSSNNGNVNTITVNVNTAETTNNNIRKDNGSNIDHYIHDEDNMSNKIPFKNNIMLDEKQNKDIFKHVSRDDAEDDYELTNQIIESVNNLKDLQAVQNSQINGNNEILHTIVDMIDNIRESNMNDKKVSLKKLIYECLDQGFATPEQNEKITSYYSSYRLLNGNGEIERLYEDHYLKLNVHRDRRNNNYPYDGVDRRGFTGNCEYGKYDSEIESKLNEMHKNNPVV